MSATDYLYVYAEMSAILVGFSAVVVTFRKAEDRSDFSSYTLSNVIQRGLATALFATLPGLLSHVDQLTEHVWRLSSLAFFTFGIISVLNSFRWFRSVKSEELPFSSVRYYILSGTGLSFSLLTGFNIWAGIPWIYMVNITWLFISTGFLVLTYIGTLRTDA